MHRRIPISIDSRTTRNPASAYSKATIAVNDLPSTPSTPLLPLSLLWLSNTLPDAVQSSCPALITSIAFCAAADAGVDSPTVGKGPHEVACRAGEAAGGTEEAASEDCCTSFP